MTIPSVNKIFFLTMPLGPSCILPAGGGGMQKAGMIDIKRDTLQECSENGFMSSREDIIGRSIFLCLGCKKF